MDSFLGINSSLGNNYILKRKLTDIYKNILQCKSYVNKPVRIRLFNKLLTKAHNF